MEQGKKVLVGISGGVDSSVAAALLKDQGYSVTGAFMKNWEDDDGTPYCSVKEDFLDAASVCNILDIDLIDLNFSNIDTALISTITVYSGPGAQRSSPKARLDVSSSPKTQPPLSRSALLHTRQSRHLECPAGGIYH